MGRIADFAASVFDLVPRSEVKALREEVASLAVRNRMRPTSAGTEIIYGQFQYEFLQQLKGDARWDVYDKMEADPHIKQGLDSVLLPLVTGRWEIQAASDKPKDQEIAEFVAANLLRKGSERYGREYWCGTSWTGQRLPEILDMLKCGFALFAKSTREVNGKIVYDRIQWLEPRSVDPHGWELTEDDKLVRVKRTYSNAADQFRFMEPVEANQLALYTWDFRGARYEGRSRLRSLYGPWMRKDAIVRLAVVWAQKAGAPAPIASYPSDFTRDLQLQVELAAKMLRGQSPAEAYASLPKDKDGNKVEFDFPGAQFGEVDRLRGLVNGENAEMAHGFSTTKSKLGGEQPNGNRSAAENQSEDEDLVLDAVAQTVCALENDGIANLPGIVQELVSWNFPNVKDYPQLVVTRIGPREDFKTLDPLVKAIQAGIVPLVPSVCKQVTEKFGIELADEEYEKHIADKEAKAKSMAGLFDKTGAPGGDSAQEDAPPKPTEEDDVAASLALSDVRSRLAPMLEADPNAPMLGHRRPNRLESSCCSLAAVQESFRVGAQDATQVLRVVRDDMIRDLMGRLRTGKISPRSLGSMRQSRFRGDSRAVARLSSVLSRVGETGQQHALEELKRQEGGR